MSKLKQLILQAAQEANILTLTSSCNVQCIFCSNRQNPPGVEVFSLPPLAMDEVKEVASFLSTEKKIVIGESVTRICEGEPFTHPLIKDILFYLRSRFPRTLLQITTNGTLLDQDMVSFLRSLAPIEIILSLNSSNVSNRILLMNDECAATAVESAVLLSNEGIPFHGSLVAMPDQTGWDDVGATLRYLAEHKAQTIRVFLPGFTRLAPRRLQFGQELWLALQNYVSECRRELKVPIACEPALLENLNAEILGVIEGSPAARAGLKQGDMIQTIDARAVFSRVDAYNQLKDKKGPISVEVVAYGEKKAGPNVIKEIHKTAGLPSGVVVAYDLAPEVAGSIDSIMGRMGARQVLILASVPGAVLLKTALEKAAVMGDYHVVPVPSRFFGGSIIAAGLLVIEDFLAAVKDFLAHTKVKPLAIVAPAVAFDRQGRDLTGRSYFDLEQELGVKVFMV